MCPTAGHALHGVELDGRGHLGACNGRWLSETGHESTTLPHGPDVTVSGSSPDPCLSETRDVSTTLHAWRPGERCVAVHVPLRRRVNLLSIPCGSSGGGCCLPLHPPRDPRPPHGWRLAAGLGADARGHPPPGRRLPSMALPQPGVGVRHRPAGAAEGPPTYGR